MKHLSKSLRIVDLSARAYQVLLYAYPRPFRVEYGAAMAQVFRDCCLRAERQGGLAGLWGRTILDYLVTVVGEHANRGAAMSRSSWIKLSGWALAAGALLLLLSGVAGSRPEYSPYNAASLPIDRYLNGAVWGFMILSVLLIAAGMLGLRARFSGSLGRSGKASLLAGAVAGLVSIAGIVGLQIVDNELTWGTFLVGLTFMLLGLGLAGFSLLRQNLLGRWGAAALLAGFPMPLLLIVSIAYEAITGRGLDPGFSGGSLLWGVVALGLVILGLRLQSSASAEPEALGG